MDFRAIIMGIVLSGVLFLLLVASRFDEYEQPEVTLLEVELATLPDAPDPPELEQPEPEPDDLPPPPSPDIDLLESLTPIDQPPIQLSPNKMPLTTPVETFRTSTEAADLPKPKITKPKTVPKKTFTPERTQFSLSELDSTPKVLSKGSFRWPRNVRGTSAKIQMRLKITKTGNVEVISILSSTLPAMNDTAKRVATKTKFTPPKKNGKAVEATYTYTYSLTK